MYDRILVPTDGSSIAGRAGEFAVSLAETLDAELHVIYVEDVPGGTDKGDRAIATIEKHAETAELAPVSASVDRTDGVHQAIIDYATDNEIDAIVMGTHGRTGVNRFLLGSVAEQTLRESPTPVLTVHEDTALPSILEDILVPTDGSDGADAATDHAIALAQETGATLHGLYVSEVPGTVRDEQTTIVEKFSERVSNAGLDTPETAVYGGRPHQAIAAYATENEIDCIVMGTHGRSGLSRYLLGSVTERTVRFASVPVIGVKAPRETATVEFLDYEAIDDRAVSFEDDDLFAEAATMNLSDEQFGTIEVDHGEYILDAAEAAGHSWPFHCRAGACINCAAILIEGEVEMDMNRSLSEEEMDEENLRLTCVGTPASDRVRLVYNAKELESLRDRVI